MRWIKSSALFLAASLTLGAGLTALTADPAAGTTGQATLHKGSDKITLTWVARKNGAAFLGTIGNLSIEGSSVQPDPDVGTFDVSGKLEGKTNLHLTLSLASAKPTALAFPRMETSAAPNSRERSRLPSPIRRREAGL